MYRHLPLLALILILALTGCERKRDDTPQPTEPGGMMEEPVTPPNGDTTTDDMDDGTTMDNGTTTDTQICTPEWFAWVHQQVQTMPDGNVDQLYPSGLPEVGSEEWFVAVDKLTGGTGTQGQGPAGGTPEWCAMIQQRLSQSPQSPQTP